MVRVRYTIVMNSFSICIWMSKEGLCTKTSPLSTSHQLPFDQGVQIIIPLRSEASVPESIGTPSDGILHQSEWPGYVVYYVNQFTHTSKWYKIHFKEKCYWELLFQIRMNIAIYNFKKATESSNSGTSKFQNKSLLTTTTLTYFASPKILVFTFFPWTRGPIFKHYI